MHNDLYEFSNWKLFSNRICRNEFRKHHASLHLQWSSLRIFQVSYSPCFTTVFSLRRSAPPITSPTLIWSLCFASCISTLNVWRASSRVGESTIHPTPVGINEHIYLWEFNLENHQNWRRPKVQPIFWFIRLYFLWF